MNILVCVKRIPVTGGKVTLNADAREIDARHLGFAVSPHEECAVEEAVRLVQAHGGSATVLTLGPEAAIEQLRDAMATGIDGAILLETDGREWDPSATARAIAGAIRARHAAGPGFDLLLFGNEAADTGDHQVGIRVAHALDLPCVTGVKALSVEGGSAVARREGPGGWETFVVPLPAVVTLKEGINVPRYPSLPGRLRAKKKAIERVTPEWTPPGLEPERLRIPEERVTTVEVLGTGPEAVPRIVELLRRLRLL